MNHETLTPKQQTDYENAETLARHANNAFNDRLNAATLMAEIDMTPILTSKFEKADRNFKIAMTGAQTLMPPRVAFEADEPITPFASEAVWNAMSPEQQKKAAEIRQAIASGPLAEFGVTEDTLRVVMTTEENDGFKSFHLIHTGNGVDIGNPKKEFDQARSYNSVMSSANDALFQVEVNGAKYDTRRGMTAEVYDAKVADAKQRGVTLPYREPLSQETDDVWAWTMLTGEELTADGNVPVSYMNDSQVDRDVLAPNNGHSLLRVCPVVKI